MSLKRALGPFDAIMVVVGGIIGAAIFVNPYIVARGLDSTSLVLGAWVVGGLVAIIGPVVFADWVFFGLTVAGLFRLRQRFASRVGFRTPGYPWLPGAFVLVALVVVARVIGTAPVRSAMGLGLLGLGIPAYDLFKSRTREAHHA